MSSIHLWAGNLSSKQLLETYLDQSTYLKAWDIYNHEPPTGNPEEDAEPSPALRCQFCKDTDMDTYDEDMIIYKYYDQPIDANTVARDFLADETQVKKHFKNNKLQTCNAVITYRDKDLDPTAFSASTIIKYLGTIGDQAADSTSTLVHYLWTGSVKHSKAAILKSTGLKDKEISHIHFFYSKEKKRLDEIIILEVADFQLAERMILKVDAAGIPPEANAILVLSLHKDISINSSQIGEALKMDFVGAFDA